MESVAFILAFILTIILSIFIIKLSYRKNILDHPKEKSIHKKPVPMLGGVVIFSVFFITNLALKTSENLLPLFLASLPILISGIYDDIKGMNASQKLLIQFISSIILISFGIVITRIRIPFGGTLELGIFSIPATILWLILMTNLVNVIDGLDGLAVGLSAIIFLVLINFIWSAAHIIQLVIFFAVTVGFLIFNFHPAKIFLGNNGSTFLGFAIAYFALVTSRKSPIMPVLILPCIILAIHLADILYAMTRRARGGISIFKGDKRHIHHVMLNIIGDHKITVLIFYLISLGLAFAMINLI